MKYMKPEEKNYVAEGNVIISLEEYNKLNKAMKQLEADQNSLQLEQNKLSSAVRNKMFLYQHTSDRYNNMVDCEGYEVYDLSKDAEELLKPALEQRLKEKMKEVYKEFSEMKWGEFIQWRKSYKEDILNG